MLRGSGRKKVRRCCFFGGQGGFYLFVWLMFQGGGERERTLAWAGNRGGFYPADNGVI